MSSQLAQNDMELDTPLKKRLAQLMTDGEKDYPFSFATRVGLNKSTFHNIWTKGSHNIHLSTAKKIADATGVNVDWLHKGIGEPYDNKVKNYPDFTKQIFLPQRQPRTAEDVINEGLEMRLGFNPDYIANALDIIDDIVASSNVHIDTNTKAELIIQLCSLMNTTDDMDNVKKSISSVLKILKTKKNI